MMILYECEGCAYCAVVREALNDKNLDFDVVEVPADKTKRDELFKVSGQNRVPVLINDDRVISDSQEIISYLEENFD